MGDGPTGIGTVVTPVDPMASVRENTDRLCRELLECTNRYAGVLPFGTVIGCLELHKLHIATRTIETEDRFGTCVEPQPTQPDCQPEPVPPRPRLFTTAEKDAYIAESATKYSGQKLFPNEVSRCWWTIARNGVPVVEGEDGTAGVPRPRVFSWEELDGVKFGAYCAQKVICDRDRYVVTVFDSGPPSRVIMEGDPLPWEQKEGGE